MLYAKEMALNGNCASITTVSRRGKPAAPGPSAAFLSLMSEETVHYMAACDQTDAKAVECLTQWAAPVSDQTAWQESEVQGESGDFGAVLAQLSIDIPVMNQGQIAGTVKFLKE